MLELHLNNFFLLYLFDKNAALICCYLERTTQLRVAKERFALRRVDVDEKEAMRAAVVEHERAPRLELKATRLLIGL